MSHTIGQAQQDTQESNSNSNLSSSNSSTEGVSSPEPISGLSDADREFLFNQLLEGIAHGWHDRRIIKFFQQLGDRGQQSDWIIWLERLREKVLKLPIQSKRPLGSMMIRLGELTQSASEVAQIGAASRRIGQELLFGNVTAEIWEYAGPDLSPAHSQIETERELSARLPSDFTALGAAEETNSAVIEPESFWDINIQVREPVENINDDVVEDAADRRSEIHDRAIAEPTAESLPNAAEVSSEESDLKSAISDKEISSDFSPDLSENNSSHTETVEPEELSLKPDTDLETFTQEFELDLARDLSLDRANNHDVALGTKDNASPHNKNIGINSDSNLSLGLNLNDEVGYGSLVSNQNNEPQLELEQQPSSDTSAIENEAAAPAADKLADALRVFELESEVLASESTNVREPRVKSSPNLTLESRHNFAVNLAELSFEEEQLDESNLEVIESWFNLGLKQVSAGEYDRAIASWDKALSINAHLSEAWHNRGSALGRLGKYSEAVKSFQNALKIDPNNYQAWNDRAHALYQLQSWSQAVESWSQAIEIMPGNHLFWYNRGCALEQLSQWQEAIASYGKALEIKPDFQLGRSRYINLVADNSRPN